ncbi:MAG TPA: thiamine pyrophosphate-dependent dehydrogenase E1 component subunit alpha [Polyangiaceae bacterium]
MNAPLTDKATNRVLADPARALQTMLLIRRFEEQAAALQQSGQSPSMCTSVGQEASAVGVVGALEERDLILTNHRSAGHLLARGAEPERVLAEIMGKSTGYCGGKSGSLHISVKDLGVLLTSTIVGGELSLVTGVALSLAMSRSDAIATCFFGDGAAAEGIFHESLNLAAVWNLPILYVCENNQWQAFVHRRETMIGDHVSEWARPYGVRSLTIDGNDVEAVAAAAQSAAEYVRSERKPFLLETYTYRLRGHMEPDDQGYVDRDELERWQKQDPITTYEKRLLESGRLTPFALEALREQAVQRVERAAAFALASPYPGIEELTTHVYA